MKSKQQLLYLASTLSGFTALGYQYFANRYVSYLIGSEARSVAMVTAVFLGSLCIGHYFFGRTTFPLPSPPQIAKRYALLEFSIATWALSFPYLQDLWRVLLVSLPQHWSTQLIVVIFCLAPGVCMMGGTLPLLVALSKSQQMPLLYGLNTLAAGLGIVIAFILTPFLGLKISFALFACFNILLGLLFFKKSWPKKTELLPHVECSPSLDKKFALVLAFLSGSLGLTVEMFCLRWLGLAMGTSVYVLPIVLFTFVVGIGIGSLTTYKKLAIDYKTLIHNFTLACLWLALLGLTIGHWPLWIYLLHTKFFDSFVIFILVTSSLFFFICFPFLFYLGRCLPLIYLLTNTEQDKRGQDSGRLLAINGIGTLAGALFFGHLFLNWWSSEQLLKALVIVSGGICLKWGFHQLKSTRYLLYGLIPLIICLIPWNRDLHQAGLFHLSPQNAAKEATLLKAPATMQDAKILFFEDGPTATVSVLKEHDEALNIMINAKNDGSTKSPLDLFTVNLLADLPLLLHPSEEDLDVAVVGLGTGVTAGIFNAHQWVRRVDVIEISAKVLKAMPFFSAHNYQLDKSKKVTFHQQDALTFFRQSEQKKYDIVSSEPTHVWSQGVENLYMPEYYQEVSQALKNDGIFVQWLHLYDLDIESLKDILRNLLSTFPHLKLFRANYGDLIFVASKEGFSRELNPHFDLSPLIRSSLMSMYVLEPNNIWGLLLAETNQLKQLVKDRPLRHHRHRPGLAFFAYLSRFKRQDVSIVQLRPHYIHRRLNMEVEDFIIQSLERSDLLLGEDCWNLQAASAYHSTLCQRLKRYRQMRQAFFAHSNYGVRLKAYSELRDERFMRKDLIFLSRIHQYILQQKHRDSIPLELLDQLLREGEFELAQDWKNAYQKANLLSPLSLQKWQDAYTAAQSAFALL